MPTAAYNVSGEYSMIKAAGDIGWIDEKAAVPDVWDSVWQSVQISLIRAAIMRLAPEQRSAIELAYFQGRTHVEIAEALQIPLGTVKARLRLGIIHLRQLLMQMGLKES
jgi:RNA polymerase sigma-70 factor (ECF subfamily)